MKKCKKVQLCHSHLNIIGDSEAEFLKNLLKGRSKGLISMDMLHKDYNAYIQAKKAMIKERLGYDNDTEVTDQHAVSFH